jgi:hypothetical protein
MKKAIAALAIVIIAIASVALLLTNLTAPKNSGKKREAYVGVAYGGDSVSNGKLLIDKVKDYTNLFVLQSATLQRDFKSVDELGDYAISKGLYFLPYFGFIIEPGFSTWLQNASLRWGTHLLGIYYADEPGGKMLDDYVQFKDASNGNTITKTTYGDVVVQNPNGTVIDYQLNGNILAYLPNSTNPNPQDSDTQTENSGIHATFYPNGTITATQNNETTFTNEPIPNWTTPIAYTELANSNPFKNTNDIANSFCTNNQNNIMTLRNTAKVFTSDYALYWFDYQSGYDVVLAQIGWNESIPEQIALDRGAAKLQNKDWGVMITWKYDIEPYLDSGQNIFNQLQTAYRCGAKYFILFDYYNNQTNPYGTMKEEHFTALKDFWNQIVKNPNELQGSVTAESALVLPKNYGCAMRWKEDKIWGVIEPNQASTQIFNRVQSIFSNGTLNWDIIYDDASFHINDRYLTIQYWNQTT